LPERWLLPRGHSHPETDAMVGRDRHHHPVLNR